MATWKGLGSGARGALLGVATIVASVGAYGLWDAQRPAVPAAPDATVGAAPEPATPEPAAVATQTTTATTPSTESVVAEAPPIAPGFDVVRIEPDGSALVAGRAEPGSDVSLQVDGAEVARATTSADGKFVAMFSLIASPTPRLMSLMMTLADGSSVTGPDTVAIAPITAPVVVAGATPPEPATPEAATPQAATPEAVTPETVTPETVTPETVTPETVTTETATTETATPKPATIEAETTETATSEAATNPPATLLVTEDGVQVLQPGGEVTPEVAAEISLDTIAYSPEGAVQLAGRGTAGQFVRLYLDNSQISLTPLDKLGKWSVTLENIAPGIYTLRVDQVDASGKVTSRLETPFKRETLEALAAAMGTTAATAITAPATSEVATTAVTTTGAATPEATSTEVATPEAATPEAAISKAATETATTEPATAQAPAGTTSEPTTETAAAETAATDAPTSGAATSSATEGVATDATTTTGADSTDVAAAEAAPTEAAPTETAPTEAEPTETAPNETVPTEAAPTETATTVTSTTDPGATETAALENATTQTATTQTATIETATTETATTTSATPAMPVSMTVQPGNTLWAIAKQNWGDGVLYVQLWQANKEKIRNPDLIYPGQVFTIPEMN